MREHSLKKKPAGYSLIEVLVALFLLALRVLGAAALQMNSLTFNQTASMRTQATFLAYEMIDRMRANRTIARNGNYVQTMSAGTPTRTSVAQRHTAAWTASIQLH